MTALGPRQKPRPTAAAAARTRRASEWQAMLVLTQSASASPELPRRNRACSLALNHGHCSRHGSERRTGYGTFLTEVCLTSVIAKSRVKEYLSWVLAKVCCSGYWAFQSQSSFFWRSSGTTKARTPTEFVGVYPPRDVLLQSSPKHRGSSRTISERKIRLVISDEKETPTFENVHSGQPLNHRNIGIGRNYQPSQLCSGKAPTMFQICRFVVGHERHDALPKPGRGIQRL
jgi:hypothetical protein